MKQTWMRLWPFLTAFVAFLSLYSVAALPEEAVPLEDRLASEQARLDRLEAVLCSERSSSICRAIDDEQVAIKEMRGEIGDFEESQTSASDRNQLERGLAKLRDEISSLERSELRSNAPMLGE